jgi:uncharacterized membrane protein HdeD (DUF308 family)
MPFGDIVLIGTAVAVAIAATNLSVALWMAYKKPKPAHASGMTDVYIQPKGQGETTTSRREPSAFTRLPFKFLSSIHEHWILFLIEGITLLVLGTLAIIVPPLATIAVDIFIGWLFLISGVAGLITTFGTRHAPGFWWSLLSALLAIAAGLVLLTWPVSGASSLTLLLIVFFFIEGIATIMYALEHKAELTGRWGWMMASGIIDLILGAIILLGLPGTAAWALGLLVGINMLFGGAALIAIALHARHTPIYASQAASSRARHTS